MRTSRVIRATAMLLGAIAVAAHGDQAPGWVNIFTNVNLRFVGGSFSYAYAYAYDSIPGGVGKNNIGTVNYPGMISAGPIDKSGNLLTAHAKMSAVVAPSPFGMTTTPIPDYYVHGGFAAGFPAEGAAAEASFEDPMIFSASPGALLSLSFNPGADMGVTCNPSISSSASIREYVNTDIPNFASLFSLSVNMSSSNPGQVQVSFTSNPLLGLDDAAISSKLKSGFSYDPNTGQYSFDPTGQEVDASVDIPSDDEEISITTGGQWDANGSVPEPSTFALLGIGAIGLLAREYRRRASKA